MKFSLRLVKAASDVVSAPINIFTASMPPNVQGGEQAGSDYYRDDFLYDLDKDPFELTNVVSLILFIRKLKQTCESGYVN